LVNAQKPRKSASGLLVIRQGRLAARADARSHAALELKKVKRKGVKKTPTDFDERAPVSLLAGPLKERETVSSLAVSMVDRYGG
jgi:hypothetical protein